MVPMLLRQNFFVRVAGPTVLVSALLLGLCVAAAVILYLQQASAAAVLGENVSSTQVAHDLENTLNDLVLLLRARNEHAGLLHARVRQQLDQARQLADKDEEQELVGRMEDSFGRYLKRWQARPPVEDAEAVSGALAILEQETLPACDRLQAFNARQIQESEAAHRQTVRWLVAGLIAVGVAGALVGVWLGYDVARGLRRSIHHLSIRVQDAASKLGQELPLVALTEDGPLGDLHGRMQGVVREIERVVERLQQREREVLRAEQLAAVGQLAAGAAHELRNPLTSIKLLVQANREEVEAQHLPADDLAVIEQEVRRMERCLQTFLDFARPPRPQRHPLDLAEAVGHTLALVGGRARKQRVALRWQPPDAAVVIEADREQVQQLLVNLALNALDVMPAGGTLEVELRPAERGLVELRMLDSGPGVAADVLPRLFEPFVSTKETGLGLGLVISRRIAEGHGGTLRAANRPEGGACFVLRLPAAASSPLAPASGERGRG